MTLRVFSLVVMASLAIRCTSGAPSEWTVFEHVNVIPMHGEAVLPDQTVMVRGDRIAALGSDGSLRIPDGAHRIQGSGQFLIPGLGEMHGHIPTRDASPRLIESILFLYLSNGVTTVRGMLGGPGQLEMRERAARGEIWSPTLYLAGPSFSGNSIHSVQEAVDRVREQKREGWDLLKIHPGLTLQEYDALADTAAQEKIDFAGHVPLEVGIDHALERGQVTIDHLDGYLEKLGGSRAEIPEGELLAAARQTRAFGAWVVPTMALWETVIGAADLTVMQGYPELQYLPREMVREWVETVGRRRPTADQTESLRHVAWNRKRLLRVMNEAGVRILFGTDAPQLFSVPGFSVHRETKILVEAGMTPYQILRSATRNVGEYLSDKDDAFGTVSVGMRADLVLLEDNPLVDITHLSRISGVMVRGRWLPVSEIRAGLARIASAVKDGAGQ